jgi:hypothetical protein
VWESVVVNLGYRPNSTKWKNFYRLPFTPPPLSGRPNWSFKHILGLTNVHFEKNRICSACQAGKQVGVPHPAKNVLTTTRPLELLHMDIFGPVAYVSIGGNKYGFVIVDDYSRYTWVLFMKDKSKVHEIFKKFATRAQN